MPNKNNAKVKRVLIIIMMVLIVGVVSSSNTAYAEDDDDKANYGATGSSIVDLFTANPLGEFQEDGKNYYQLDLITDLDIEVHNEGAVAGTVKKLLGFFDAKSNISEKIDIFLNGIANFGFKVNMILTSAMLIIFDFAYSFNMINLLINDIEFDKVIKTMTGIENGKFNINSGIFGNTVRIIALIVSIYALYTFILKRAFLDSLQTLLKSILILTFALLLFSNYTAFLKSANLISNQLTTYVLATAGSTPTVADAEGDYFENDEGAMNGRSEAKDMFWSMFVDRPYLYMQYGSHSKEEIGIDRITGILKMKPGKDRYEKVLETEFSDGNSNEFMVQSAVWDRLAFTPFYLFINGMISIPIFILSLSLVTLQFWFIVMAIVAPFALLIGAIPGFFGVTKRYLIELALPLVLKVFLSFFIVFIISLSSMAYKANFGFIQGINGITSYIGMGVFQFILFATIFFMRKRIMGIFTSGSNVIAGLREQTSSAFGLEGLKKGVQGTATVVGAGVGALASGGMGAGIGASIGSTAGRLVTGEAGTQEVASTASRLVHLSKLDGLGKDNVASGIGGSGGKKIPMTDDKKQDIMDFFGSKENNDEGLASETVDLLEKEGLSDVTEQELEEQYNELKDKSNTEGLNGGFADNFASGIKERRLNEKKSREKNMLKDGEKPYTKTSENASLFLHGKNAGESLEGVVTELENKGLDDVSVEEMQKQFEKMDNKYENGQLKGDFASEFTKGIEEERALQETNRLNDKRDKEYNKIFDNKMEFCTSCNSNPCKCPPPINTGGSDKCQICHSNPCQCNVPPETYTSNRCTICDSNPCTCNSGGQQGHPPTMMFDESQNVPMDNLNFNNEIPTQDFGSNQFNNNNINDGQNFDSSNLNNNPINDGQSFDSTNLNNNPIIDGQSFDSSNLNSNSITEGQSLNSSNLNNNPINDGQSLDSSTINSSNLNSNQINEGQSFNSTDLNSNMFDSEPMNPSRVEGSESNSNENNSNEVDQPRNNNVNDSRYNSTTRTDNNSRENHERTRLNEDFEAPEETITERHEEGDMENL